MPTKITNFDQGSSSTFAYQSYLPGILSLIAGMSDTIGWITLSGLFTAHITGNLVVAIADYGRGKQPHLAQVLAIPVFIAGIVLANILARIFNNRRAVMIKALLLTQTVLFFCAFLVAAISHPSANPNGFFAIVVGMAAIIAMAVQYALLHLALKQAPSTAVMTGNLVVTTIALIDIALNWGEGRSDAMGKWKATYPLLLGFLAGCFLATFAVSLINDLAWFLPAATSLVLFVTAWRVHIGTGQV